MEQDLLTFLEQLESFGLTTRTLFESMLLPSRLRQLAMILVMILISRGVGWWLSDRVFDRIRAMEGISKAQLRAMVLVARRLRLIVFVALIWGAVFVMRDVMHLFPSRSYLLVLAGRIALAWLLIGLLTGAIRNPLMRRIVRWGAWIYATLYFMDLDDDAAAVLETVAIEIQNFRLSALNVLQAMVVTGALFFGARMVSNFVVRRIRDNKDISPTLGVLMSKLLQAFLYVSAVFLGLRAVGFDLTGLTVLSGAIGVGIGFGLQKIVSNIVSGVIILMDKSVKPGDVISLGETFGWIQSLGARYVSVVTRDGREYLIPNEDLITGQVVNWSHSDDFVRLDIHFGTSYGSDPHLVRQVAVSAALSVSRVLQTKTPVCHITGFGDSSVDYILRFWIIDPAMGLTNVRGNVNLALWDAFAAAGITFPFPQREVRLLGTGANSNPNPVSAQKNVPPE